MPCAFGAWTSALFREKVRTTQNQIKSIDNNSPLRGRAAVGDSLVSINGNKIVDVLDYKFFAYDSVLKVVLRYLRRLSTSSQIVQMIQQATPSQRMLSIESSLLQKISVVTSPILITPSLRMVQHH